MENNAQSDPPMENNAQSAPSQERTLPARDGLFFFIFTILAGLASILVLVYSFFAGSPLWIIATLYLVVVFPLSLASIRKLQPQEAFVLTLFGKYHGTLKGSGLFVVNPFAMAFAPGVIDSSASGNRISLKAKTLSNDKQKINDLMGNPILIDTVVVWRIVDTAKAVFDVDNYVSYLSIQCESSLRNIVSLYPYDTPFGSDSDERTLRGSSQEIAHRLKLDIQEKANVAGLEILEARITNLSYAPEIAAAMLQRQQASAIIDAKHTIVEGAVDIVRMALQRLAENDIVHLTEERKAAMVSNLLVVLCGNKDAQPIVNQD